ncbi:hypothetical protein [Candidatus Synchoanobacter obligatus]|uniref:Uncharacterized protein n=1 Tax=Candidatus Synchoanobacter obligatus TaxID=2919597 RepID=A0ABT1L4W1_9GAMM|nr:hypothetical protein [Candidatus Synchoanobacter obligatus]MCP8352222.1 hypothetical protein [Candidatus Synchoanobacter obligatus]
MQPSRQKQTLEHFSLVVDFDIKAISWYCAKKPEEEMQTRTPKLKSMDTFSQHTKTAYWDIWIEKPLTLTEGGDISGLWGHLIATQSFSRHFVIISHMLQLSNNDTASLISDIVSAFAAEDIPFLLEVQETLQTALIESSGYPKPTQFHPDKIASLPFFDRNNRHHIAHVVLGFLLFTENTEDEPHKTELLLKQAFSQKSPPDDTKLRQLNAWRSINTPAFEKTLPEALTSQLAKLKSSLKDLDTLNKIVEQSGPMPAAKQILTELQKILSPFIPGFSSYHTINLYKTKLKEIADLISSAPDNTQPQRTLAIIIAKVLSRGGPLASSTHGIWSELVPTGKQLKKAMSIATMRASDRPLLVIAKALEIDNAVFSDPKALFKKTSNDNLEYNLWRCFAATKECKMSAQDHYVTLLEHHLNAPNSRRSVKSFEDTAEAKPVDTASAGAAEGALPAVQVPVWKKPPTDLNPLAIQVYDKEKAMAAVKAAQRQEMQDMLSSMTKLFGQTAQATIESAKKQEQEAQRQAMHDMLSSMTKLFGQTAQATIESTKKQEQEEKHSAPEGATKEPGKTQNDNSNDAKSSPSFLWMLWEYACAGLSWLLSPVSYSCQAIQTRILPIIPETLANASKAAASYVSEHARAYSPFAGPTQ